MGSRKTHVSVRERRYFRVRGRVQAVGFRYFTRATAIQLNLVGHVRNRQDGGADLEAEGQLEGLDRLEEALRKGPPGARVKDVFVEPRTTSGSLAEGFSIIS